MRNFNVAFLLSEFWINWMKKIVNFQKKITLKMKVN